MTGPEEQVPTEAVRANTRSPESLVDREDVADGVRLIALNRPAVRNAFNTALYLEFTQALLEADRDEAVGAVVITGRGAGFSSGQDLVEMAAMAAGTAVEGSGQGFTGLLDALTEISVPLLAAVNGVAVGLGFHHAGALRSRPCRRRRPPARAVRRARCSGRSGEQRACSPLAWAGSKRRASY